jgi:hypothetical protein
MVEVHEPDLVAGNGTISPTGLHVDAVGEKPMDPAVVLVKARVLHPLELSQNLCSGLGRNIRIQASDGVTEGLQQKYLVLCPGVLDLVSRHQRVPVEDLIAQAPEPGENLLLQFGLCEAAHA